MHRHIAISLIAFSSLVLSACQTLPSTPTPSTIPSKDARHFAITGKIGISTTLADGSRQAGSAFYVWGQEQERFNIDLTGVLGMGATNVQYNGRTATITSDKGSLSADTPEELLARTTGWHAPISQLAYWVVGTSAPNDKNNIRTDNRLDSTHNGDWQAIFEYSDSTLPNRLIITHTDGHRVVMTITHVKQL